MYQERKLTLKERSPPTEKVKHKRLPFPSLEQLFHRQATLVIIAIPGEEIFVVQWPESTFVVVTHAVTAVLGLVHALRIVAEERGPGLWLGEWDR